MVFRVQFHTCTVHGAQLWFGKTELDVACTGTRTELHSEETHLVTSEGGLQILDRHESGSKWGKCIYVTCM